MAIEIIIFTALIEMALIAMAINMRALDKAVIGQRIKDHVLRDTASARQPQALRGFMRINNTPRIAPRAEYINPWPDMHQSIADDVHMSFAYGW